MEADAGAAVVAEYRRAANVALRALCDGLALRAPGAVGEAIRYSILGEGKRWRPVLLMAAYAAAGGHDDVSALAAAAEVVHAYSLVHDDLPCMDDDDVRRGRATAHRVFGVQTASIAGTAMVPLAAYAACHAARALRLPWPACGAIVRELMRASGAGGMVGGQLLDLRGEGRSLSLQQLEQIHRAKTGALISASVRIGVIAACGSAPAAVALARYGDAVGLAFQIADDILDATASTGQLGKTAGRDAALGKSTYVAHVGINGARAQGARLVDEACTALHAAGVRTAALEYLARSTLTRTS